MATGIVSIGQSVHSVRVFPSGCTIVNIRRGKGYRKKNVYACLRGPDGDLLISATLDYILEQLANAEIQE